MSAHKASRAAGMTMVEMLVVSAFGLMTMLTIGSLTQTTNALATQSRGHLDAEARLRVNLQQICNVLRSVSQDTWSGFDPVDGTAAAISFERVVGLTDGEAIYSGLETLEWRATAEAVDGVAHPGAVWLVSPAGDRIVAPDVPRYGFLLRQDGGALLLSLRVYHRTARGQILEVTGETSVTARNDA